MGVGACGKGWLGGGGVRVANVLFKKRKEKTTTTKNSNSTTAATIRESDENLILSIGRHLLGSGTKIEHH